MSGRPSEKGPSGSSTNGRDASLRLPSLSTQTGQHAYEAPFTSAAPSPAVHRHQAPGRTFELPPLPQASTAHGGRLSPSISRLAGVSSILNPSPDEGFQQSRRRKASEVESPSLSATSLPPLTIGNQSSYQGPRMQASPVPSLSGSSERPPRRILTPRSPSLHRAASLSQLNSGVATVSAQRAPFPPSPHARAYAIEPGTSGAPPLPTPPAAARHSYGFVGPTPPSEPPRRTGSDAIRGARAPSPSASPSTSYSSYSQGGQTSPAAQYAPMSMATLSAPYPTTGDGLIGEERPRPFGIPISSSGGQNVYQMMTLETTSGTVQLPVDVQAASRVADEKRRRNAGASARFRQRRKEKEKEASTTISRLEQQVKELTEDLDFYKREREYLAGVVSQMPSGDRHFPRPPSPRRRPSTAALAGSSAGHGTSYGMAHEPMSRSPQEGRNVRRRTSTLSLPPPPPPPSIPPQGVPYQTGYNARMYGSPLAPQPHLPLQQAPGPLPSPLSRDGMPQQGALPLVQQAGPPQPLQATPHTGPWNPYAVERRDPGSTGPTREQR